MRNFFLSILCLLFFSNFSFAQQTIIKGTVVDTFNNESLEYATVAVLRASDSILLGFNRTDDKGKFSIAVPKELKYMMLVTRPGFADYIDIVTAKERTIIDLGQIVLFTREKLLSEFVIQQNRGAIYIKGDTTEYIADSFKVDPNASVESLLKKLPGLQVDKDGNITAQGEKVQKILVDGEEFFSDDPAVVNKNLQAKTVDKIQVFDKKSEQTEFTGIDDGERTKTINLKLKDKYKKGFFGKLAVGGGNDGFYENQGMFNYFRGKQKFSVYGIAANTGRVGLSYQDNSKFGSSGSGHLDEESGVYFQAGGSDDDDADWGGKYNGTGLPSAWTAGAHYSNKWNEDKHHLSFNYRFNRKNIEATNNSFTQYSLPDSVYYKDQKETSSSSSDRHGLNALYEFTIDTLNTLKFSTNASKKYSRSNSNTNAESKGASGGLINSSLRNTSNDADISKIDLSLTWKKKFKKKGRTLITELDARQNESNQNGYLFATNKFFAEGNIDSTTAIDQNKKSESQTSSVLAMTTYTEPISKKGFLELQYRFNNQNNFSRQLSFNKNGAQQYSDLDSVFSSDYDFDVLTHRAGASLRWVYEKLNFSFGAAMANTNFIQTDNLLSQKSVRNFNNFFPSATMNYKFSQQSSLYLNYRGSTTQPTIQQIQPIRQNADPINLVVGNPNLKQEFSNQFSFRYNSYKVLKGTYYYAGGGVGFTNNEISTSQQILASGIRISQYINVQGNNYSWFYGGVGFRLPKYNLDYGIYSNINTSRNNNLVNGEQNKNDNNSYSVSGRVSYDKEKKWSISYDPSVTYHQNNSSLSKLNTNYWSTQQEVTTNIHLPKKFEFNLDVAWNIRQRTAAFDRNNNVLLVNAYLGKKFTKKDEVELRISVFDIFNQNLGFSQVGTGNIVEQQSYNRIRRYGLLSLIWNFTYSPKSDEKSAADIIEIAK